MLLVTYQLCFLSWPSKKVIGDSEKHNVVMFFINYFTISLIYTESWVYFFLGCPIMYVHLYYWCKVNLSSVLSAISGSKYVIICMAMMYSTKYYFTIKLPCYQFQLYIQGMKVIKINFNLYLSAYHTVYSHSKKNA